MRPKRNNSRLDEAFELFKVVLFWVGPAFPTLALALRAFGCRAVRCAVLYCSHGHLEHFSS
jgi:hypothetical protein